MIVILYTIKISSKRSSLGIILQENSGYTAPTYWTTSQQNIQNVSTPEDWG